MRLRKKHFVEVANFDFLPSLTANQSEASIRFAKVVNTLKLIFTRDRLETINTDPDSSKPSESLDENSSSKDLTESL